MTRLTDEQQAAARERIAAWEAEASQAEAVAAETHERNRPFYEHKAAQARAMAARERELLPPDTEG